MDKTPEQMLDEVKTEVRTSLEKSLDEKVQAIKDGIDAQMRAGFAELVKPQIQHEVKTFKLIPIFLVFFLFAVCHVYLFLWDQS